jgi:uncharacterized protein YdbL (DUF1318 family)
MSLSVKTLSRCALFGSFAPLAIGGLLLLALGILPALAQTADVLRRDGKACEQTDGFLRALTPDARQAVDTINAQRRTVYQQRAEQQRVDIAAVGAIFAQYISTKPDYRACTN